MKYRSGTPRDAEAIAEINIATWRICFDGIVPKAFLDAMSLPERTSAYARRFSKTGYDLVVAEDENGTVAGFLDFGPPRDSRWSYDTELYSIYVAAHCQRRSIGTELFKRAVSKIVGNGGRSLFARVLEVSPFRSFYLRCGAHIIDLENNQIGGQTYDHIIYAWDTLTPTGNGCLADKGDL